MRAASTPASSISDNSSPAVNFETLRCRPEVGTTVWDQICTCASMIFMAFLCPPFCDLNPNWIPEMLDVPKQADKSHADGKILQSVTDGVGVITFNNPEKRNAMSLEMWEGLGTALTELRDNPDVRVVIMVGAGDKAFVSGADISQFEKTRHNAEASEEYS